MAAGKPDIRYDYVISCAREEGDVSGGCCGDTHKVLNGRRWVEENLKAAGLITSVVESRDKEDLFIRISASQARLEKHAEFMKLQIPTQIPLEGDMDGAVGDYMVFISQATDPEKRKLFPDEFSSATRVEILLNIIEGDASPYPDVKYCGYDAGAGIKISHKISDGVIKSAFALHEMHARRYLKDVWVKRFWTLQPIDDIRKYFGEKVALYFAFIGFYTGWLVVPAILGLIIFILQNVTTSDSIVTPVYAIFMMIWSTLFLEFWKRHNGGLAHKWNVLGFEDQEERNRPEFHGDEQYGFYVKGGGWISLEDEIVERGDQKVDRWSGRPIPKNLYVRSGFRIAKYGIAVPLLGVLLVGVAVVSLAILALRVTMAKHFSEPAYPFYFAFVSTGLNSALNAVVIIILNVVYGKLAHVLVNWENHRTQSEHDDSLVTKTFLFQFINSYFSLFYIAFFKGKYPLCITSPCVYDTCAGNSCFDELQQALLIFFGVKALVAQLMEVLVPLGTYLVKRKLDQRKIDDLVSKGQVPPPKPSQAEVESLKDCYVSTFDDFNELALQFGYVIIFACALPIAPLMALGSNVIEIRSDAFRLLQLSQRPVLGKAEDIGSWLSILEVMSFIGVITNCFLLAFTSDSFASANNLSITQRIWFAFILEHAIMIIKIFLAFMIPDTPGYVKKEIAKRAWIKDCQVAALEAHKVGRSLAHDSVHAPSSAFDPDKIDIAEEFDDE